MRYAAFTVDVDSLASIYRGYGLKRDKYSGLEIRQGLETFCRFLEPYNIKATLFMIGNDFLNSSNIPFIKAAFEAGHELANHTMTHAQGFRTLSIEEQEKEIKDMEEVCKQNIGVKPVGFRAPGWNMSDKALPILLRRGYRYDSSIHPTLAMPILKLLHRLTAPDRERGGKTTLGQWSYMFAPLKPYRTSAKKLSQPGKEGLIEFPVTVVPPLRVPFWHTFTLKMGLGVFKHSYQQLKKSNMPIIYLLHISDFVDYTHPELQEQIPAFSNRRIPQALHLPWNKKKDILQQVLETMLKDYIFSPLKDWTLT